MYQIYCEDTEETRIVSGGPFTYEYAREFMTYLKSIYPENNYWLSGF